MQMSSLFVRNDSGLIDLSLSLEAFQLAAEAAMFEEEQVEKAVLEVFSSNVGRAVDMSTLVTMSVGKLGSNIEDMGRHADLIKAYVKRNTGTVADFDAGKCLFGNAKGRAGGTRKWSDQKPDFLVDARKKLADKTEE
jgi:hypothetical protein